MDQNSVKDGVAGDNAAGLLNACAETA